MGIVQNVKARYSTKSFDATKTLTSEQIDAVKELLRFSPSSVNSQPWHFVLASTPQAKQRIAKATQGVYKFNEAKVLNASHVLVFCAKTSIDEAFLQQLTDQEDQDGRFADLEAKVGQLNAKKYFVNMHRFDLKDANHWMEKQVYLNLGSLLLGVSILGIDAVPIEGFDAKELDEEFALRGRGYTSLVIVPLGVRSDDDFNAALPKSRLPEAQLFSEF